MKCPFCGYLEDKVVDSRESREGEAIRRRRECLRCERRFTSYERIDEIPYMVVKKDGRRETFDRNKVMAGLVARLRKATGAFVEARLHRQCHRKVCAGIVGARKTDQQDWRNDHAAFEGTR